MFNVKEDDMLSIVLTKDEHKAFTNMWRREIGYAKDINNSRKTGTVEKQDVIDAAKRIYKDYPKILKVLGL